MKTPTSMPSMSKPSRKTSGEGFSVTFIRPGFAVTRR